MARARVPTVVLFGYNSSPFTNKIRLALAHRQIPYTLILVPSMMPRPILVELFNLTYRKIPVLSIDRDVYVDTSLILEVLATHPAFSNHQTHPPLHPDARTRTLTRILSSHYTDRPLFRLATGLIPQAVWETSFGTDRADLIGHTLDAHKLGSKIPRNLSGLDTYLSILEPLFITSSSSLDHPSTPWLLSTPTPSAADITLYYQLDWGEKISRGQGVQDLTGGGAKDGNHDGMRSIFNKDRYPGILSWFERMKGYMENLPNVETRIEECQSDDRDGRIDGLVGEINRLNVDDHVNDNGKEEGEGEGERTIPMLRTPVPTNISLDAEIGLIPTQKTRVSIAPDDTGRDSPTVGRLVALSTEEVVIVPERMEKEARVKGVRIHFPRVGFVVRPVVVDGNDHGRRAKL